MFRLSYAIKNNIILLGENNLLDGLTKYASTDDEICTKYSIYLSYMEGYNYNFKVRSIQIMSC